MYYTEDKTKRNELDVYSHLEKEDINVITIKVIHQGDQINIIRAHIQQLITITLVTISLPNAIYYLDRNSKTNYTKMDLSWTYSVQCSS